LPDEEVVAVDGAVAIEVCTWSENDFENERTSAGRGVQWREGDGGWKVDMSRVLPAGLQKFFSRPRRVLSCGGSDGFES